ncbi:DUF2170 family protein [Ectothiorhodospiraceae bacterium BW-2]|nr:DUF2170 family protein [Ectothiorhodospiraceae bacterium BW-2]
MVSAKLQQLLETLEGATTENGLAMSVSVVDEIEELLQVTIEGREEFPIMVDIDEEQITCTVNLWSEEEVIADKMDEMIQSMLMANIPMPLSAFGKTGSMFQLFGAMSVNTIMENVIQELSLLSDNTLDAFDALGVYLKK